VGQLAARAFQVSADKPLELLQVPGLVDRGVVGTLVDFVGLVDGVANVFDNAVWAVSRSTE
jgi:hypothetical protein